MTTTKAPQYEYTARYSIQGTKHLASVEVVASSPTEAIKAVAKVIPPNTSVVELQYRKPV